MNRVDGKVALVTGAASGIGAATARVLADAGARVVITDVNEAGGSTVASKIGERARFVRQDVTQPASWREVLADITALEGRLDVLVNNAGVARAENIETMTLADWHAVLSVNLDGVFLGMQAAVNAMKESGGAIVNISSIMGLVGGAGPAYNASKGGVRLLTKSVMAYCARMGYPIRVNSVHPGYIWTPMVEGGLDQAAQFFPGSDPAALKAELIGRHPIGRFGEPEEIARGVLFLASDDASFITGSELVIDGGYTAV